MEGVITNIGMVAFALMVIVLLVDAIFQVFKLKVFVLVELGLLAVDVVASLALLVIAIA
jgi:hypothetical protein